MSQPCTAVAECKAGEHGFYLGCLAGGTSRWWDWVVEVAARIVALGSREEIQDRTQSQWSSASS